MQRPQRPMTRLLGLGFSVSVCFLGCGGPGGSTGSAEAEAGTGDGETTGPSGVTSASEDDAESGEIGDESPGSCGDGVTDSDEECDDGNQLGGDGCTAQCVLGGTFVWQNSVAILDDDGSASLYAIAAGAEGPVVAGQSRRDAPFGQPWAFGLDADSGELEWDYRYGLMAGDEKGGFWSIDSVDGRVVLGGSVNTETLSYLGLLTELNGSGDAWEEVYPPHRIDLGAVQTSIRTIVAMDSEAVFAGIRGSGADAGFFVGVGSEPEIQIWQEVDSPSGGLSLSSFVRQPEGFLVGALSASVGVWNYSSTGALLEQAFPMDEIPADASSTFLISSADEVHLFVLRFVDTDCFALEKWTLATDGALVPVSADLNWPTCAQPQGVVEDGEGGFLAGVREVSEGEESFSVVRISSTGEESWRFSLDEEMPSSGAAHALAKSDDGLLYVLRGNENVAAYTY